MLHADLSVCPRRTYRASSVAFAFFIAVSGLAGMKLVIGAPLHWFLALTAFTAWAVLRPEPLVRTTLSVFTELLSLKPGWLFFWGAWLCFCLGILLAGATNDWAGVYTVPKYLALMGVLWLLVAFVPTNEEIARGLYLLALVGLLGLAIIWFLDSGSGWFFLLNVLVGNSYHRVSSGRRVFSYCHLCVGYWLISVLLQYFIG